MRVVAVVVALVAGASVNFPVDKLERDPVAFVVGKDHELHVLNHGATDDDLRTRADKLSDSAWSFFRGTSPLFYRDLAELPPSRYATGGDDIWLLGDPHLENTGADNGQFAFNDTDDSRRGSWTWDVRRAATSIVLAGRHAELPADEIRAHVDRFVGDYAKWVQKFREDNEELTWRLTEKNSEGLTRELIDKSDKDTRAKFLKKWTSDGKLKGDELEDVDQQTKNDIADALKTNIKDIKRRTRAGTGSLGRFRWYVLTDDQILELKQEPDGGQRPAQTLGWLVNGSAEATWVTVGTVPVLVKEKSPFAEDLSIDDLTSFEDWDNSARDLARLLAAAHTRADKDIPGTGVNYDADAAIDDAITSIPGLRKETREFATRYADQVERDWRAYKQAHDAGRPTF
ncbi:hypothetical protein Lesp02_85570 [Lentzea sp. NBRC 105346]|uniref:DUF2252 family protein n=1 Tax=Lentzea sp. NBRC 105346 TaxID=3032205 RepID=UPI0024A36712|nr:DUF2252 family protein [Lentzea sp. NBRC 105346]GLZ36370.1 hypothetical protein Lesp02_85570 [Lentzea sp. NBRC 105346]